MLEFQINLSGTFASALDKANAKLKDTDKDAKKASESVGLFEGEIGNLSGSIGGLKLDFAALGKGGHFFTFNLAEGIKSAVELVTQLAEKFVDLGKEIVGVAAKRQDLDLAIKLNVGDDKAKEIGELAEEFEQKTRFDESDIKSALLPLLQQGLGQNIGQLRDLTTAATDYAARMNLGAEGVTAALQLFSNMALKGQVNFKMLKGFGISEADYIKDLADLRHESAKSTKKMMHEGKVDKDQLLNIAMNQIQRQQGGALGRSSNQSVETLGATLQRLGHLKENLFEGLADSPGMAAVNGFLQNFLTVMTGSTGKELMNDLGKGFEAVFGDLSGPQGLEKVRGMVNAIAGKVGEFVKGFREIWPEIQADFVAAIPVFEKFAKVLGTIGRVLTALPRAGEAIGDWLADHDPGGSEVSAARKRNVIEAAAKFGPETDQRIVAPGFAMHPGADSDSPLEIPAFASGGIVDRPTLALIGESGPEAVVPLSENRQFGGSSSIVFAPQFNVTASGGASEMGDVRSQLAEVEQAWRIEFKKILDEAAASLGATVS